MQTFLPYADFKESARVLDYKRLGKQRVECKQIFKAGLFGGAWMHHPAVKMWHGCWPVLEEYYDAICSEWVRRGYKHTMTLGPEIDSKLLHFKQYIGVRPNWLGDDDFHRSHRSKLLFKDREHYSKYFEADLPDDLPYVWPCHYNPAKIKSILFRTV